MQLLLYICVCAEQVTSTRRLLFITVCGNLLTCTSGNCFHQESHPKHIKCQYFTVFFIGGRDAGTYEGRKWAPSLRASSRMLCEWVVLSQLLLVQPNRSRSRRTPRGVRVLHIATPSQIVTNIKMERVSMLYRYATV